MTYSEAYDELAFYVNNGLSTSKTAFCTPNLVVANNSKFFIKLDGTNQFVKAETTLKFKLGEKNEKAMYWDDIVRDAVHISNGKWLTCVDFYKEKWGYLTLTKTKFDSNKIDLFDIFMVEECEHEDVPADEQYWMEQFGRLTQMKDCDQYEPAINFDSSYWCCSLGARINYLKSILPELEKEEKRKRFIASMSPEEREAFLQKEKEERIAAEAKRQAESAERLRQIQQAEADRIAKEKEKADKQNHRISQIVFWIVFIIITLEFLFSCSAWWEFILVSIGAAVVFKFRSTICEFLFKVISIFRERGFTGNKD